MPRPHDDPPTDPPTDVGPALPIVFEIADLVHFIRSGRSITGIQRTALMILCNAVRLSERPDQILVAYLHKSDGVYRVRSAAPLGQLTVVDAAAVGQALGLKVRRSRRGPPPMLERYSDRPAALFYHMMKRDLAALSGNRRYFDRRGASLEAWRAWRGWMPSVAGPARGDDGWMRHDAHPATAAGAPHAISVIGSPWDRHDTNAALAALAAAGVPVSIFVYDMIPITRPEWFVRNNLPAQFRRWFAAAAPYCAGYIAISRSTAADLDGYLTAEGYPAPIIVLPLAQQGLGGVAAAVTDDGPRHDDPSSRSAQGGERGGAAEGSGPARGAARSPDAFRRARDVREDVKAATRYPYVLCVGTIETRKNIWRLIQAWKAVAEAMHGDAPRLVLAGSRGWLNDDVFRTLDATAGFGGWIQFVERPSDTDLDYLYRGCDFTAMVSLYEGWGLPIGEGLSYGKTAIVSDVSSMPEVGGDLVVYCDPERISSIRDAALTLIRDPLHRAALEQRIAGTVLRSWEDVARDAVQGIRQLSRRGGPDNHALSGGPSVT